jgi:hypothetical protein
MAARRRFLDDFQHIDERRRAHHEDPRKGADQIGDDVDRRRPRARHTTLDDAIDLHGAVMRPFSLPFRRVRCCNQLAAGRIDQRRCAQALSDRGLEHQLDTRRIGSWDLHLIGEKAGDFVREGSPSLFRARRGCDSLSNREAS